MIRFIKCFIKYFFHFLLFGFVLSILFSYFYSLKGTGNCFIIDGNGDMNGLSNYLQIELNEFFWTFSSNVFDIRSSSLFGWFVNFIDTVFDNSLSGYFSNFLAILLIWPVLIDLLLFIPGLFNLIFNFARKIVGAKYVD